MDLDVARSAQRYDFANVLRLIAVCVVPVSSLLSTAFALVFTGRTKVLEMPAPGVSRGLAHPPFLGLSLGLLHRIAQLAAHTAAKRLREPQFEPAASGAFASFHKEDYNQNLWLKQA